MSMVATINDSEIIVWDTLATDETIFLKSQIILLSEIFGKKNKQTTTKNRECVRNLHSQYCRIFEWRTIWDQAFNPHIRGSLFL